MVRGRCYYSAAARDVALTVAREGCGLCRIITNVDPEHVVIVYVSFMYLDFVSFGVISAINEHTLRQSSSAACSPEGTNQVRREGSSYRIKLRNTKVHFT